MDFGYLSAPCARGLGGEKWEEHWAHQEGTVLALTKLVTSGVTLSKPFDPSEPQFSHLENVHAFSCHILLY